MKIFSKVKDVCVLGIAVFELLAPSNGLYAAWNSPVFVSSVIEDAATVDGPVLSVNSSNNGVSVWTSPPGFFANILASSYTFGSGWSSPVIISDTSLNQFGDPIFVGQGDPDVAMNQLGYVVAAWEGSEFLVDIEENIEGVFSSTRSPDGIWSSVQRISNLDLVDNDFDPENPSVAVNDSGLSVAVWTELRNNNRFIMTGFLPMGGSWSTPFQLDALTSGVREDTPRVAINPSSNAVAVWKVGAFPVAFGIHAATYNSSTGLWTTVTLDSTLDFAGLPTVAMDDQGNAVATWLRTIDSLDQIVASYFTFGGGWSAPVVIFQTPTGLDNENAYVTMDPSGNATVVWTSDITGSLQVYASTLPLGGAWSAPIIISIDGIDNIINVGLIQKPIAVTSDLDGNVIVIISQNDDNLQSVVKFSELGWQAPENIFNPIQNENNNIGIGSCGFALALWLNTAGSNDIVQAADNFGIFPPPINFTGRRCCQKFASQKVCLSLLNWAPGGPCIAFFTLRRNGEVIATIPALAPPAFQDVICDKNVPITYTLTATNIFDVESAPVSIILP